VADDHLVQIERAEEKELVERKQDHAEVHESMRSGRRAGDQPSNEAK
jgi:hypothetical protein